MDLERESIYLHPITPSTSQNLSNSHPLRPWPPLRNTIFTFSFPHKYYFIYPSLLFTLFPCQLFQVSFSLLTGVLHLFMSLSQSPSCFPPCHLCLDRRLACYGPKGRVWSLIITLKTDSAKMTVFPSAVSFPFRSLSSEKRPQEFEEERVEEKRGEETDTCNRPKNLQDVSYSWQTHSWHKHSHKYTIAQTHTPAWRLWFPAGQNLPPVV